MAISADDATLVVAFAGICSAIATVWLACVTRSLARRTESLVEITKAAGKQAAEANQRDYELTRHQIDLHAKASVYEDALAHMYDDFLVIQGMAANLGVVFVPKAYGANLSRDEKAFATSQIVNRISLHGSNRVGHVFTIWLDQMNALHDILNPDSARNNEGNIHPIQDPKFLATVTTEFNEAFDLAKNQYMEGTILMREELHPDRIASP